MVLKTKVKTTNFPEKARDSKDLNIGRNNNRKPLDKLHHIKIRFFYLTGNPVKDMSLNVPHPEENIMMMSWYLIHEEYFYNSKIKHNLLKIRQNITTTTLKRLQGYQLDTSQRHSQEIHQMALCARSQERCILKPQ